MAVNRFHVEAWTLPLETTSRLVARVPFISGMLKDPLSSQSGRASIVVRSDWERLSEVVDPDNDVETLLRVFQNDSVVGSFFATRTATQLTDDGTSLTTITGRPLQNVLGDARILNFDYPARPTVDPDWIYGNGADITGFKNPSFEESDGPATTPTNDVDTDFEDQTLQGWLATRYFLDGFEENDATVKVNNTDAQAGTYSMEVNAGVARSGFRKQIRVTGGESYTFTWYMKSVTTGARLIGLLDLEGGTASHTNAWVENNRAGVELGNVAKGTGSTDGTWQQMTMTVTYPTFSTEPADNFRDVWLYAVFDDTGNGPLIRLDSFTGSGAGLGLLPWKPLRDVSTFEQSTTQVLDGTYSAHVVTSAGNAGIWQRVTGLTPGRRYTFTVNVYHATGSAQFFDVTMRYGGGDGIIASNTYSADNAAWDELSVTGTVDAEDVIVQVTKLTAGDFYVDQCSLREGTTEQTPGSIATQFLNDLTETIANGGHTDEATARFQINAFGSIGGTPSTWLDYSSWTITVDSAGNPWSDGGTLTTIAYRGKRGKKLSHFFADMVRLGYEYNITDNLPTSVDLDFFNPYDWSTRTGGVGTNRVGTSVPVLRFGAGVKTGPVVKAPGPANRFIFEGPDGKWDVRRDATKEAAVGSRADYVGDRNYVGDDTIGQIAAELLEKSVNPTTALKVELDPQDNDQIPIPYRDFQVGDTYPIDLAGHFTGSKRVVQVTTNFTPGYGQYVVEFDNVTFTSDPTKAMAEAVRILLDRFDELDGAADTSEAYNDVEIVTATGGGPVEPSYLLVGSNVRDELKAVADYVCDGTDDDIELAEALAAGGRIFVAGSLTLDASASLTIGNDVHLIGLGHDTVINGVSGSAATLTLNQRSTLSNVRTVDAFINVSNTLAHINNVVASGSTSTQNYVLQLSSSGSRVSDVYLSGGSLATLRIIGTNNMVTGAHLDLPGGVGLEVTADRNIIQGVYVASADEEGVEITSTANDNLITNLSVENPWQAAGTGVAISVAGDRNTLDGVRVGASGYTYAIEITATGDSNIIGVYSAAAGTSGTVNDLGTNTVDYLSSGTTSPLTTKGDLWVYTTTDARLAVGTNDHVLTADSTAAAGVAWKAVGGGGGGGSATVLLRMGDVGADAVWLLNEGSGTTAADSRGDFDQTYSGTLAGMGATALVDSVLSWNLNGSDDNITFPGNWEIPDIVGQQFSFYAVINPDSVTGKQVLFKHGGTTSGFVVYLDGTSLEVSAHQNSLARATAVSTTTIATSTTYQICATWFGARHVRLFVNGTLEDIADHSSWEYTMSGTADANLGASNAGGTRFGDDTTSTTAFYDGRISHAAIWNRQLADWEVGYIYDGSTPF